jgi:hypothetical protein
MSLCDESYLFLQTFLVGVNGMLINSSDLSNLTNYFYASKQNYPEQFAIN